MHSGVSFVRERVSEENNNNNTNTDFEMGILTTVPRLHRGHSNSRGSTCFFPGLRWWWCAQIPALFHYLRCRCVVDTSEPASSTIQGVRNSEFDCITVAMIPRNSFLVCVELLQNRERDCGNDEGYFMHLEVVSSIHPKLLI